MKPLEGVKIVDFTQAHAGSLATMLLSDFGAEVMKIERPGVGESGTVLGTDERWKQCVLYLFESWEKKYQRQCFQSRRKRNHIRIDQRCRCRV